MIQSSSIQESPVGLLDVGRSAVESVILHWTKVVRGAYLEVPALSLTLDQIRQLWELDEATSNVVVTMLCETRFLSKTPAGAYRRELDTDGQELGTPG